MLHPENVIYNALIRAPAESILKQHANELADLGVVFLNDNEYVSVKQHDFVSSSMTEVCTHEKCRWVICLKMLINKFTHTKSSTLNYFNTNPFDEIFKLTFRDYSRKSFWVAIPTRDSKSEC